MKDNLKLLKNREFKLFFLKIYKYIPLSIIMLFCSAYLFLIYALTTLNEEDNYTVFGISSFSITINDTIFYLCCFIFSCLISLYILFIMKKNIVIKYVSYVLVFILILIIQEFTNKVQF